MRFASSITSTLCSTLLTLFVAAGCTKSPPVRPKASPPVRQGALLFELKQEEAACTWIIHDIEKQATQTVYSTPKCPSGISWYLEPREVHYTIEKTLFVTEWPPTDKVTAIEFPKLAPAPWSWTDPWIDQETKRLRVGGLVEATIVATEQIVEYRAGGRVLPAKEDDGWHEYYLNQGRVLSEGGDEKNRRSIPPWGTSQIAILLERGDNGTWRELAAAPSSCEACDTPCWDVLSEHKDPLKDTVVLNAIRTTCSDVDCWGPKDWSKRTDILEALDMPAGEAQGPDGVGFLSFDELRGLLFRVEVADSPHAMSPVYYCEKPCQKKKRLETADGQLAIAINGEYALIAKEYSNTEARVFKASQIEPVFRSTGTVAWLPPSTLWQHNP